MLEIRISITAAMARKVATRVGTAVKRRSTSLINYDWCDVKIAYIIIAKLPRDWRTGQTALCAAVSDSGRNPGQRKRPRRP